MDTAQLHRDHRRGREDHGAELCQYAGVFYNPVNAMLDVKPIGIRVQVS